MSLRWELAPYSEPWTAPPVAPKSAAIFKADWDNTLWTLGDETGRLDAGLVVIEVDVRLEDLARSRQSFRVGGSPSRPGVRVVFDCKNGRQRFATAAYSTWRANVRAVALTLTMLRAVDRYGTSDGAQYIGFRPAIESPSAPVFDSARDAIRWMIGALAKRGDSANGAPDQLYKRLAKMLHPDTGEVVNVADWSKLQAAKNVLSGAGVL